MTIAYTLRELTAKTSRMPTLTSAIQYCALSHRPIVITGLARNAAQTAVVGPGPDRVVVDLAHGWAGPISTGVGSGSGEGACAIEASAGILDAISRWMGKMPG